MNNNLPLHVCNEHFIQCFKKHLKGSDIFLIWTLCTVCTLTMQRASQPHKEVFECWSINRLEDEKKLTRMDAISNGQCIDEISWADSAGQLIIQSNQLRSTPLHFILFRCLMPESHSLVSSDKKENNTRCSKQQFPMVLVCAASHSLLSSSACLTSFTRDVTQTLPRASYTGADTTLVKTGIKTQSSLSKFWKCSRSSHGWRLTPTQF